MLLTQCFLTLWPATQCFIFYRNTWSEIKVCPYEIHKLIALYVNKIGKDRFQGQLFLLKYQEHIVLSQEYFMRYEQFLVN